MADRQENWTPGPWKVEISGMRGAFRVYSEPMRDHEARVALTDGVDGYTVSRANRDLIAAAPDLYAALENAMGLIIAWGATYQAEHRLPDMHPTHAKTVADAQAALSKARGETTGRDSE